MRLGKSIVLLLLVLSCYSPNLLGQEKKFYDFLPEKEVYSFWEQGRQYHVYKHDDLVTACYLRPVKGIGQGIQLFLNIYNISNDPNKTYFFKEQNVYITIKYEYKYYGSNEPIFASYHALSREEFFKLIDNQKTKDAILKGAVAVGASYFSLEQSNSAGELLLSSLVAAGATQSLVTNLSRLNTLSTLSSLDYLGRTDITNYRPILGFLFIPEPDIEMNESYKQGWRNNEFLPLTIEYNETKISFNIPIDPRQNRINIKVNPNR